MSASVCEDPADASEPPRLPGEGTRSEGSPSSECGTGHCDAAMDVEGRSSCLLSPRGCVGEIVA